MTLALAKQVPPLVTAASPKEVSKRKTAVKDLDTVDRRENVEVNVFVRSTKPLTVGPYDQAQGRLAAMRAAARAAATPGAAARIGQELAALAGRGQKDGRPA